MLSLATRLNTSSLAEVPSAIASLQIARCRIERRPVSASAITVPFRGSKVVAHTPLDDNRRAAAVEATQRRLHGVRVRSLKWLQPRNPAIPPLLRCHGRHLPLSMRVPRTLMQRWPQLPELSWAFPPPRRLLLNPSQLRPAQLNRALSDYTRDRVDATSAVHIAGPAPIKGSQTMATLASHKSRAKREETAPFLGLTSTGVAPRTRVENGMRRRADPC